MDEEDELKKVAERVRLQPPTRLPPLSAMQSATMDETIRSALREELGPNASGLDIGRLNPEQRHRLWGKVRSAVFMDGAEGQGPSAG